MMYGRNTLYIYEGYSEINLRLCIAIEVVGEAVHFSAIVKSGSVGPIRIE